MEREDAMLWLVRETDNRIHGPYSRKEILKQLKEKKIKGKTEISQANSYWFGAFEKEELEKFFPEFGGTKVGTNPRDVTSTSITTTAQTLPSKTAESAPQWLSPEYADDFGLIDMADSVPVFEFTEAETPSDILASANSAQALRNTTVEKGSPKPVPAAAPRSKLPVKILAAFFLLAALLVVMFFLSKRKMAAPESSATSGTLLNLPVSRSKIAINEFPKLLRQVFLLEDLEQMKKILGEMENQAKGDPLLAISKSLMKRYYLFDGDGAFSELNAIKDSLVERKNLEAELENLSGIYLVEKDPAQALTFFRSAIAKNPAEKIFSLNLARALYLAGKATDAEKILLELIRGGFTPAILLPDLHFTLGLVLDSKNSNDPAAETQFRKALDLNPLMPEPRLLLAVRKIHHGGIKEADADLHAFLEPMADIDGGNMIQYRLLPLKGIFSKARKGMRDANVGANASAKPAPLYLAIDAILSLAENKYNEAERILDDGLGVFPSHIDLLKAMAYVNWKQSKFTEILDLLKGKEGMRSYAIQILLGRAYLKLGNYAQAEKSFATAVQVSAEMSDAWASWGDALVGLKMNQDALKKYEMALQKDPFNLHAVQGYFRSGREDVLEHERYHSMIPF